jgi:hypothetical protein
MAMMTTKIITTTVTVDMKNKSTSHPSCYVISICCLAIVLAVSLMFEDRTITTKGHFLSQQIQQKQVRGGGDSRFTIRGVGGVGVGVGVGDGSNWSSIETETTITRSRNYSNSNSNKEKVQNNNSSSSNNNNNNNKKYKRIDNNTESINNSIIKNAVPTNPTTSTTTSTTTTTTVSSTTKPTTSSSSSSSSSYTHVPMTTLPTNKPTYKIQPPTASPTTTTTTTTPLTEPWCDDQQNKTNYTNSTTYTYWCLQKQEEEEEVTTIRVRIVNPKMHTTTTTYSVLATIRGMYTISGYQSQRRDEQQHYIEYIILHIKYPGKYQILVHEVDGMGNAVTNHEVMPITSSNVIGIPILRGRTSISTATATATATTNLPPCHTFKHDSLTRWDADWLGPQHTSQSNNNNEHSIPIMRTGWALVSSKCQLNTYSEQQLEQFTIDLLLHNRPKTIAFLGTSRERGVMQTIGAMLLKRNEKDGSVVAHDGGSTHQTAWSGMYQHSSLMDCRGGMSIQVNGLKVLYRDIRINTGGLEEEDGTVTCHGSNLASYSGYLKNATKMMTKVTTEDNGTLGYREDFFMFSCFSLAVVVRLISHSIYLSY